MPILNDTRNRLALALTSDQAAADLLNNVSEQVFVANNVVNANATANTLADITGLSFPVVAGRSYRFSAIIHYNSAATTTGARFTVNGPASPTALSVRIVNTLTATTESLNVVSAYNAPAAASATSLAAGNVCLMDGIITPSAAGVVQLQFASEVSASAITVLPGSVLDYRLIA